jgi:hypothetical protein
MTRGRAANHGLGFSCNRSGNCRCRADPELSRGSWRHQLSGCAIFFVGAARHDFQRFVEQIGGWFRGRCRRLVTPFGTREPNPFVHFWTASMELIPDRRVVVVPGCTS